MWIFDIYTTRPHTPAFKPAVNRNPGKTGGLVYRRFGYRRFGLPAVWFTGGKTGGSTGNSTAGSENRHGFKLLGREASIKRAS